MARGTELAFRANDGIEVSLRWHRTTDRLSVVVRHVSSGKRFELAAPKDRALDVFYHPFAYEALASSA